MIVAVAVNTDGRREVLGMTIGNSEAEPFWTEFLRSLTRRGLRGTKLVVGNAAGEALAGQHAEFAFSHVQPTAVLGRVVPLEPLDEAAGLIDRELHRAKRAYGC